MANQRADRGAHDGSDDTAVQRTRAWTGLGVVVFGDVAIAVAAVFGVVKAGGGTNAAQVVSILTSAFTAIGTMTTAYFGIRAASNTAQSAVKGVTGGEPPAPPTGEPRTAEQTEAPAPEAARGQAGTAIDGDRDVEPSDQEPPPA
jgi:hypothetical protein